MRSRAACLEQRSLLDDEDIAPAELSQVISDAATYDARTNDDGLWRASEGLC